MVCTGKYLTTTSPKGKKKKKGQMGECMYKDTVDFADTTRIYNIRCIDHNKIIVLTAVSTAHFC